MQIKSLLLEQARKDSASKPYMPFSMVALETDTPLAELQARLSGFTQSYFGKVYWAEVSDRCLVLILQGLDTLVDVLDFVRDTFAGLCTDTNTGCGIARYPLDGLQFDDLLHLSTTSSANAFLNQTGYQISNRDVTRQNLYRELESICAASA